VTPLPWSHTALEDFKNCPHAYHQKRVVKAVKEEPSEQIIWGNRVHKAFENRVARGDNLPSELDAHEPFFKQIVQVPGVTSTELQIALNRQLQPCAFFDKAVWFRGVVDFQKIREPKALVLDYKTGKPHSKFGQLKLFALYIFAQHPRVDEVTTQYYWVNSRTMSGETYTRDQIPALWGEFIPDLKQYAEAFRTDTWQRRPSGLCNGWCPVVSCEFWKPRKK
jgi:hypothetical protein